MNKVSEVKIGARVCWHIEGTLDQTKEGVVTALLRWPSGGIRAYVVEPDDPAIIASIVPANSVVERMASQGARQWKPVA